MKKSIGSVLLVFVFLTVLLSGCAPASTPTLSPEELDKQINDTYGTIVQIQVNAEFVNAVIQKFESNELVGLQEIQYIQLMLDVVDKTDKKIPQVKSPDVLKPYWDDALTVHQQTKDILSKITEKNTYDLSELEPLLKHAAQVAQDVEAAMVKEYGYDPQDLSTYRQGELDTMFRSFDNP